MRAQVQRCVHSHCGEWPPYQIPFHSPTLVGGPVLGCARGAFVAGGIWPANVYYLRGMCKCGDARRNYGERVAMFSLLVGAGLGVFSRVCTIRSAPPRRSISMSGCDGIGFGMASWWTGSVVHGSGCPPPPSPLINPTLSCASVDSVRTDRKPICPKRCASVVVKRVRTELRAPHPGGRCDWPIFGAVCVGCC